MYDQAVLLINAHHKYGGAGRDGFSFGHGVEFSQGALRSGVPPRTLSAYAARPADGDGIDRASLHGLASGLHVGCSVKVCNSGVAGKG